MGFCTLFQYDSYAKMLLFLTRRQEIISSISTDIVVIQDAISDKVYILNLQMRMSLYSLKIMAVHFILFCILAL